VGAYLKACLKWCVEDPDAAIAAVDSRWPSIKPPDWPHVTSPVPGPLGVGAKDPGTAEQA
jgi:hypothetical protein